jgi:hypothetical protein
MPAPFGPYSRMDVSSKPITASSADPRHSVPARDVGQQGSLSPRIAEAISTVMASQVRPGLAQPKGNLGLQGSAKVIRRQPAHSIRARERLVSHPEAECMGAIYSCEIKAKESLGNRGRPCMLPMCPE